MTDVNVEQLAHKFSELITAELGIKTMRKVIRLNATAEYRLTGCCATQDYCDANMTMLAAFEALGITSPLDVDPDDESRNDLWNAAWDMARINGFYMDAK